jgi:hypothetical protein
MSGSTGADRVKSREHFKQFLASYEKIISKFPGFVSFKPSGSYNSNPDKDSFGDIDIIVHFDGYSDKKALKLALVKFFEAMPDSVIEPFTSDKHAGKRTGNTGELVTIRYHDKKLGYSAQIDNMCALDKEEAHFKGRFLDLPAEVQGIVLGLVKVATVETPVKTLFASLGIKIPTKLDKDQEWEFNLSGQELQLRKVTYEPGTFKQKDREILWKSKNFKDVETLLYKYNLDQSFDDLLKDVKSKIKTQRAKTRMAGVFTSMVSVKSGEVNTPKGDEKNRAIADIVKHLTEGVALKKAVITFGRLNIPTTGHELLIDKVISIAKTEHATPIVFLSKSHDKKKNPLSFDDKAKFLSSLFGDVIYTKQDTPTTVFTALMKLADEGYTDVTLVVGSDRVSEFESKIKVYLNNGNPKTSINLNGFKVVSAGERDPDSDDDVSGISGTKIRKFVSDGDYTSFAKYLPSKTTDAQAKHIWDLAKTKMNESSLMSFSNYTKL